MPGVELLAAATIGLLIMGSVVLSALALVPSTAKTARAAFPILGTEFLIVGTAVGAFWIGGWVLWIALLLHAGHVVYEASHVSAKRAALGLSPVLLGVAVAMLCLAASHLPLAVVVAISLGGMGASLLARRSATEGTRSAVMLDLVVFPGGPLLVFTTAGLQGAHEAWLLLAFLLVETFDSYALLGGKLFGRRPAFPVLSPRKTVEGLALGAAMLMVTAGLGAWTLGAPVVAAMGLACLAAPLAVAGDLSASRLKRLSEVKDFPQILPLQGGLFDITDAWIAVGAGFVLVSLSLG